MKSFHVASACKKDLKRIAKRGHDLEPSVRVLNRLAADKPLDASYRDHPLNGHLRGWRACHIAPDLLLVYRTTDSEVMLARMGTHAQLFGR